MATATTEIRVPGARRRRGGVMGGLAFTWWFLRRYPVIPVVILTILVVSAVIGPSVAPYPRDIGWLGDRHIPPFGSTADSEIEAAHAKGYETGFHLLGTDHVGRDTFTRVLHGARISMMIAAVSLGIGFTVGTTLGVISGYFGGWTDEIITRFVDIWFALPFLLVALIMTLIFGRGLPVLMFVLALISWTAFVRILRSQALILREMDYVAAARIAGAGPIRIMWKHIFPGLLNTAIVVATLNVGGLILAEATLSFVGAGIQPPTPAWGVMVADGRDYLSDAWWQIVMPGSAIFLVVISLNFLGDWLRDRLDPRLRQVD
ncbi:MAG: ABC transporter permease [Chloroflexi bacterium]|nr:ABC transporter permease [Chloroflexota bacterium]